ncbi:MAG: YceI family protein [Candidatus Pacebacteria bacterium]|nr:YceI family protein [Candidatus Paceibacterota bacterium]
MQNLIIAVGLIIVVWVGFMFFGNDQEEVSNQMKEATQEQLEEINSTSNNEQTTIQSGSYEIDVAESEVKWAGKKPLIDGYINSGTIGLNEGGVQIDENGIMSGSFIIDMQTLRVGLTAKKPGQETKLEEHLKSDRWFDVETYPNANFVINKVTAKSTDSANTSYDIEGDLTIKGQTHTITFPATIEQGSDGQVVAEATTKIDRTKWGLTAGSSSFFDNLADNVIDDMIELSFKLVANKQ